MEALMRKIVIFAPAAGSNAHAGAVKQLRTINN
jgi:hypothetical protein